MPLASTGPPTADARVRANACRARAPRAARGARLGRHRSPGLALRRRRRRGWRRSFLGRGGGRRGIRRSPRSAAPSRGRPLSSARGESKKKKSKQFMATRSCSTRDAARARMRRRRARARGAAVAAVAPNAIRRIAGSGTCVDTSLMHSLLNAADHRGRAAGGGAYDDQVTQRSFIVGGGASAKWSSPSSYGLISTSSTRATAASSPRSAASIASCGTSPAPRHRQMR